MDAPKSMGEYVGTVARLTLDGLVLQPAGNGLQLANGDGFAFVAKNGSIVGFRADVCDGFTVRCKRPEGLKEGVRLYRNISAAFERQVEAGKPIREMDVKLNLALKDGQLSASAVSEDGRKANMSLPATPTFPR